MIVALVFCLASLSACIELLKRSNMNRSLSRDLGELLVSGKGADITLCAGGEILKAHSIILTARCPVFAALLRHDPTQIIMLPEEEAGVVRHLLHFIYTDEVQELEGIAADLLIAADKYDLPVLKGACEDWLLGDLDMGNVAEYAVLAVQYCCPCLQAAAVQLILRDPPEALRTEGWAEGIVRCPQLMAEVSQLVKAEIRANKNRTQQALKAAECGQVADLKQKLAEGAGVDDQCDLGYTALHRAVKGGHTAAVSFLLEAGASVNLINSWRQTPLHVAAGFGNVCAAMMLVSCRADLEAKDCKGQTALQVAAACGEAAVVKILMRAGANQSAADCCCRRTPLQLALAYNRREVVNTLRGLRPVRYRRFPIITILSRR